MWRRILICLGWRSRPHRVELAEDRSHQGHAWRSDRIAHRHSTDPAESPWWKGNPLLVETIDDNWKGEDVIPRDRIWRVKLPAEKLRWLMVGAIWLGACVGIPRRESSLKTAVVGGMHTDNRHQLPEQLLCFSTVLSGANKPDGHQEAEPDKRKRSRLGNSRQVISQRPVIGPGWQGIAVKRVGSQLNSNRVPGQQRNSRRRTTHSEDVQRDPEFEVRSGKRIGRINDIGIRQCSLVPPTACLLIRLVVDRSSTTSRSSGYQTDGSLSAGLVSPSSKMYVL